MKTRQTTKENDVKAFVLDTNVLLHSAQSIESFHDNDVIIPMAVVEELDKFKKNSDELGRNARAVIRKLDRLREAEPDKPGRLCSGVPLSTVSSTATGKLFVLTGPGPDASRADTVFGDELDLGSPDNRILRVACGLQDEGRKVIFISKDINLRLKADALGLRVMDFERGKVNSSSLYSGFLARTVPAAVIDRIYQGCEDPHRWADNLEYNGFVMLSAEENPKKSVLLRKTASGELRTVDRKEPVWNLVPRNREQRMALDLLLDPEVKLVTLVGGAGTGKTLLALAAGLHCVLNSGLYDRILVSRPIIPLGNDIGFLPGSKDAKLAGWMQPIFDNLDFLLGGESERKPQSSRRFSIESLQNSHKLELEALTYIRGRSIPRQFVIVDEAQNLTPHEVKTIVSRCGDDTKMVLTGDPQQIDNPYLDASSNGLSYAVERMKGHDLFGHVTLARSERGKLAALAASLL
ncbi:MAG: PhoH family protein [Lentisphaeria bacterium]|nr:PhoH family protein [Lentisphaeria bacterium]